MCRGMVVGGVGVALAGAEALSFALDGAVGGSTLLVTTIYRKPSAAVGEFLDSLELHLSSIKRTINISY